MIMITLIPNTDNDDDYDYNYTNNNDITTTAAITLPYKITTHS